MPIDSGNLALKGLDDLFSTEENRQEEQQEQVRQIPIDDLHPFTNHPFKVLDDEAMTQTVESIKLLGVTNPLIVRPRPEGGYEIISGHRRQHAAQLAGLDTLPVIVRQMDDDAAVLLKLPLWKALTILCVMLRTKLMTFRRMQIRIYRALNKSGKMLTMKSQIVKRRRRNSTKPRSC